MKLVLKIVLSVFLVFILVVTGGMIFLTRGLEAGCKMVIGNVSLPSVDDGVYSGKYQGGRWSNEVKVIVKDHKITEIQVVKDVLFSKPEVKEELFNKVVEKQSINVDAVSGATVTSNAYLKSVENALKE